MPNFFKIRADSIQLNASASDQLVAIASGQGAPSGSDALGGAAAGIYIREDATTEDTVVYVTRDSGTTWKPLEAGGDTATFTDITVAGGIDHDKALTAAGDGVNSNTSVNHATANAEGIDLLLRQLTTARTAGTMSAIKAAVTSLAGDLGGTYNNIELVVTDGGGTTTHNAIKAGAGFDALIDVSAAGTGEADVVVGDNLAEAFQVREAANLYLTVVTTNSSEAVKVSKTLDLDAALDQDVALTGTGDGANLATSMSHATQSAEALDVAASQLTNARTAGELVGVKSSVVGLAGDTSGGTMVGVDLNVTKNGGSAVAHAIKVGAGFDSAIDLSEAATGEADFLVGDNLASALQIREAANVYLDVVSTNNAERVKASKPLRAVAGMSRSEAFEVVEDFLADAGATLPKPWDKQDTSAAGTPTLDYVADVVNGQYKLAHDATDELQALTLYWADQLMIDPTKSPIVEFRLKIDFAAATFTADQVVVFGLASARNATLDSIVSNAWFRIEGANLNILVEADDGTTDTDDQDSTIDIVDNTFTVFRIDLSNLSAIGFFVNGVAQGGAAVSAPLLTGLLQPFVEIQKGAGVDTDAVLIDYVQVIAGR